MLLLSFSDGKKLYPAGLKHSNHWHFCCEHRGETPFSLVMQKAQLLRGNTVVTCSLHKASPVTVCGCTSWEIPWEWVWEGDGSVLWNDLRCMFVFPNSVNGKPLPHFLMSSNQWWFSEICKVLFCVHFTQKSFLAPIHEYWNGFNASLSLKLKPKALS